MRYRLLIAVLVCTCVGVALGAAVTKIKDMQPVGLGELENPDADGTVHVKFDDRQGNSRIQVMVTDMLPNTTYHVYVDSAGGGIQDFSGTEFNLTTNPSGNGHVHIVPPGPSAGDYTILPLRVVVYHEDGMDPNSFGFTEDEARLEGILNP